MNAFEELERNWETLPITDIQVVKNGTSWKVPETWFL